MWDEHDYTTRWIQGLCAIFLAFFALVGAYMIFRSPVFLIMLGGFTVTTGAGYYAWRCARYALTGKGNVNRDDY